MVVRKAPARARSFIPLPIGEDGVLFVNHEAPAAHRQDLAMLLLSTAGACAEGIGRSLHEVEEITKQQAWSISCLVAIAQQLVISLDTGESE